MLRSARKRQRELAEREAAGESCWTKELTLEVRTKINFAAADTIGHSARAYVYPDAHGVLVKQRGSDQVEACGRGTEPKRSSILLQSVSKRSCHPVGRGRFCSRTPTSCCGWPSRTTTALLRRTLLKRPTRCASTPPLS